MLLGELIAIGAHAAGDVGKQDEQVVFEIGHGFRLTEWGRAAKKDCFQFTAIAFNCSRWS